MTCHDAREQFSALVDEALGGDARTALDAHLAGCAECGRELETFRRTIALVRGIEPARAPAGFVDRVLAATRPDPWPRRLARRLFLPWPVKLPLEAAALIIVGVLAIWLFQRMPEQRQMLRTEAPPAASRQESPPQAPPAAREATSVRPVEPAPDTKPDPSPPPGVRARDVQAPRSAPPAPALPRVFDKRESEDALKPPSARDEVRGQITREGFRDQPSTPEPSRSGALSQREPEAGAKLRKDAQAPAAAEAKRAQIAQSAPAERDKGAASSQMQGLAPSPPPSQVAGRLAAADHERAERDLQALVAKHGGTLVWRRGDGRVTLVDVEIPRGAYARFLVDLGRLGRWTAEREARDLPETVRMQIQFE